MPKKTVKLILANDKPYLISDDSLDSASNQDLAFLIGDKWVIACFDDMLGPEIKEVKKIIAIPEQIGYVNRWATDRIDSGDTPSAEKLVECLADDITLKEIINDNDGECEIEMEDEFTNPEKYEGIGWGDGVPVPKLKEGKVIIYY